jgi:acylphosphatase
MEGQSTQRLHVSVEGHVQGVGFRMFVVEQARALNLAGWVRNRYDGSVEVVAEGPRPQLEKLLTQLRSGPRGAFVTNVKPLWEEPTGDFTRFQAVSTG